MRPGDGGPGEPVIARVLGWAAGGDVAPLSRIDVGDDRLIDLIDRHAVAGRCLRRLASEPAPWAGKTLTDALRDMQETTLARIRAQRARLEDIVAECQPHEVVVIKGMSTYVLVAEPHTARCGDVDIVCAEPDMVVRALRRLGYRQTRAPFLHEIGEYSRGDVEVDVHAYFPVWSYSESLRRADLDPAHHPGRWCQDHAMLERPIRYPDLASRGLQPIPSAAAGMFVPDPALLSVILCAHAFMNYTNMWSISHRSNPCIRLGEIADLVDLARHPAFRARDFRRLVSRFGADDAVRWVEHVASALLGATPWPTPGAAAVDGIADAGFPRCLWWNFWARVPFDPDVLVQPRWLPMDALVERLGGNPLVLVDGRTGRHGTAAITSDKRFHRIITQGTGAPIPLALEVRTTDAGLELTLEVLAEPGGGGDGIRVDFGDVATEWTRASADADPVVTGARPRAALGRRHPGYRLDVVYDWSLLRRSAAGPRAVPMLVGVAHRSRRNDVIASTLVPIQLRR